MNANEKMVGNPMPPQEIALDVLREKYAKGEEQEILHVRRRVACALAAMEAPELRAGFEDQFLWAQENGFVPAGRINSAVGLGLKATLMNCFVQPVGDSVTGRRCGLRFQRHPPGWHESEGHAVARFRPGVVHGSIRCFLQDCRIGRRPARRANGGAADRSSRYRAFHRGQG